MGGTNHQPCRHYLPNSTMLSRCISLARAELDLANIELEDVLLSELNGGVGDVRKIVNHLNQSEIALDNSLNTLEKLRMQMDDESFQDLPPLKKLDLAAIGGELSIAGVVDIASWDSIVKIMKKGGFYSVLRYFDMRIKVLIEKTRSLSSIIMGLEEIASVGELNFVLEENKAGNFKIEFAQLYTDWTKFSQEFLASSICSTELWYSFNGLGTLTPKGVVGRIA